MCCANFAQLVIHSLLVLEEHQLVAIRVADHKFAVASGPVARLASGLQFPGHQPRVEFVDVVYANVEKHTGAFVLEFRLIFLIDLSEVDPESVHVDLHQIRFALAKAEAQHFVELGGLL